MTFSEFLLISRVISRCSMRLCRMRRWNLLASGGFSTKSFSHRVNGD
jgi:hypothetical protein